MSIRFKTSAALIILFIFIYLFLEISQSNERLITNAHSLTLNSALETLINMRYFLLVGSFILILTNQRKQLMCTPSEDIIQQEDST